MIGLSSSYFGFQKKAIFESAKAVFDLGFETAELGAGHGFEENVWETVKRIKREFPEKNYTIHALFPPLEKRFWFNPSLGLTPKNKKVIDGLFKSAEIVEAKIVGIHPGFSKEVEFEGDGNAMSYPVPLRDIPLEKGLKNLFEVLEYGLRLSEEVGCDFAIENTTNYNVTPLVYTPDDLEKVFQRFPELKLLLDTGHALYLGYLEKLIRLFAKRVGEIHLHISKAKSEPDLGDEHRPVTFLEELDALKAIKQFGKIPVIFEHSPKIRPEQILAEKKLAEEFEKCF